MRASKFGLDEETLAVFDLLKLDDLTPKQIQRIKKLAGDLLTHLKAGKLSVANWRDKESTRDAVRNTISDFLYSDQSGLPQDYFIKEGGIEH